MQGPSQTAAGEQARNDLASAAAIANRSMRLRETEAGIPFLGLWGLVLILGNLGAYQWHRAGLGNWIEAWWVVLITAALLTTWRLQHRRHLQLQYPWRLWGLGVLLFLQGWIMVRILEPMDVRIGAVYPTGLVLVGCACGALIFNLRALFGVSIVLLVLTYGGYALLTSVRAVHLWLGLLVGGSMLLAAGMMFLIQRPAGRGSAGGGNPLV